MKYIIGVDGGNTKTDYFLFDIDGNFIDFYRDGTCSHEALKDSFSGTFRVMSEAFNKLLSRNNLKPSDICSAVFGLAGCDIEAQKKALEEVIHNIGFENIIVSNDSILGIKAINTSGVCSICGTGTCAGGIGNDGKYLQVGGIGEIVGDCAGGSYLARRAVRKTFDYYFRFGKPSYINKIVLECLGVTNKFDIMEAIAIKGSNRQIDLTRISKEVFNGATLNDEVCIEILTEMADNLARSAGGAVVNLELGDNPLVILIGSVYVKGSNPILVNEFKKRINMYTGKSCNVVTLNVPPATGAVIWALQNTTGSYPDDNIRNKIIKQVELKLKEIEG